MLKIVSCHKTEMFWNWFGFFLEVFGGMWWTQTWTQLVLGVIITSKESWSRPKNQKIKQMRSVRSSPKWSLKVTNPIRSKIIQGSFWDTPPFKFTIKWDLRPQIRIFPHFPGFSWKNFHRKPSLRAYPDVKVTSNSQHMAQTWPTQPQ